MRIWKVELAVFTRSNHRTGPVDAVKKIKHENLKSGGNSLKRVERRGELVILKLAKKTSGQIGACTKFP
jgi:hypothetical protein